MKKPAFYLALMVAFLTALPCSRAMADRAGGGGNLIQGRMAESYIGNPLDQGVPGKLLAEKVKQLKSLNSDLAALVTRGLERPTWYFVPSAIGELPSDITGVLSQSSQGAAQSFSTREIWIDTKSMSSMVDDNERAKLLLHEALMASLAQISGIAGDVAGLSKMIRLTTAFLSDPNIANLSDLQMRSQLVKAGFPKTFFLFHAHEGSKPDRLQLACKYPDISDRDGVTSFERCSQPE